MTISTETAAVEYAGSGTTGPFQFPFVVHDKAHLLVTKRDAVGTETLLVVDVGFTVPADDIGDDDGGEITLAVALASGETLTIKRDPPAVQLLDLKGEGTMRPADYEKALDYLVMQNQRLLELLGRSLRIPESELGDDDVVVLPTKEQRASRYLFFDANGKATAVTVLTVGSLVVSAFIETLLDDANAAAARATLGVTFTTTTPAQVTATQANWAPTLGNFRTLARADANADWLIRGIAGGADGLEVTVVYIGATGSLTYQHEDAGATAANRLSNRGGANLTLENLDSATWRYDGTSSRWRQVA